MSSKKPRGSRGKGLRPAGQWHGAAVFTFAALLTLILMTAAVVLPSSVVPLTVTTVAGWALLLATASWVRRQHRALDRFVQAEAARGLSQLERWLTTQRNA